MAEQIKIILPEAVKKIINVLQSAGYEAWAVGGCVRDSILHREPDDWDITTSARPEQVKVLFHRTVDTGIQHGTVTVLMDRVGYEVTTYRIDGEYEDSRHPKEVTFTASLQEDLRRRDFTINAMAYNEEAGLVDIFGGIEDISKKVIRCVGDAKERFTEDALRMMRAVRFAAQLGFTIEDATRQAICDMAENLSKISAERIQTELVKLVTSPHPDDLRIAYETGITKVILPEFDICMTTNQNHPHHCYTVGEHILHSMCEIRPDKVLRLAMLFHDIGKPDAITTDEHGINHFHGHPEISAAYAQKIMRRLKFDNKSIYYVTNLVRYHDVRMELSRKSVRRAINKIGDDIFPLLFEVREADTLAQSMYKRKEKEQDLAKLKEIYEDIVASRECVSLKQLAVTGSDLIREAGIPEGPQVGVKLKELLSLVIEDPSRNTKEYLLSAAKQ